MTLYALLNSGFLEEAAAWRDWLLRAVAGSPVGVTSPLQFSDHQIGRGRAFYEQACGLKLEGIISKQADAPYAPGNRGLWLKDVRRPVPHPQPA